MSESQIRVAVTGAAGRMGIETVQTVLGATDMKLVAAVDRHGHGNEISPGIPIQPTLTEALKDSKPDVLVDFTVAEAAYAHAETALRAKVATVIGASGMSPEHIEALRGVSDASGVPCAIIPNFAVGAVLMMRFSEMAAEWMPAAEVIELHHDRKLDAPSGTAMHTAEIMSKKGDLGKREVESQELVEGARGAKVGGIPVHSVRLPGLLAHQMVLFGGEGELLTLRHDSLNRKSFMTGVTLAIRRIREHRGLVVGLDSLMFGDS